MGGGRVDNRRRRLRGGYDGPEPLGGVGGRVSEVKATAGINVFKPSGGEGMRWRCSVRSSLGVRGGGRNESNRGRRRGLELNRRFDAG